MLSFPSTLNRGGSNIITPQQSNSLKDVLNNSMKSAFNSAISKATSGQGYDTDGIRYDEKPDYDKQLDSLNFTSNTLISNGSNLLAPGITKQMKIWTPSHMDEATFAVMNNYRGYMKNVLIEMGNDGEVQGSNGKKYKTHNFKGNLAPSLFNPYHGIPVYGMMENVPLLDGVFLNKHDSETIKNLSDCSISELVRLSSVRNSILGHAKYKYADFMYCKDLGKISNNHMITLRKFAIPVGDNIFGSTVSTNPDLDPDPMSTVGDVGRMITWFDTDDNKLSDIMSYEYQATWKELNSKITQQNSQEDDESRGVVGKIINNLTPGYNKGTAAGTNKGGLLNELGERLGLTSTSATYANNDVALGRNYDNNKVYEPKDTIQDTHIYEGKLKFKQEFTLNFSYKLRAYDNINPKSAFLDLLGNILSVTYRKGSFWGGRNEILGAQPNKGMWNKYKGIVNGISDSGGQFWRNIFHLEGANTDSFLGAFSNLVGSLGNVIGSATGLDFGKIASNVSQAFSDLADGKGNEVAKKVIKGAESKAQQLGQKALDLNLGQNIIGGMMNKLGRPALYAFDSLLSGANVGLWHVTIGNPKNPIAVFGNLIMTGAKITHSGPLGLDDFPTDLHVSVSLKHAMSRDAVGIQKMYTKGQNSIYLSLCSPFNSIKFKDGKKVNTSIDISKSKVLPDEEVSSKTNKNLNNAEIKTKNTTSSLTPRKKISRSSNNLASSIESIGTSSVLGPIDPPKYLISSDESSEETMKDVLSTFSNNTLHKNDPHYVKEELSPISQVTSTSLPDSNRIYSSRFVFCGTDIQEMISNKDEMR